MKNLEFAAVLPFAQQVQYQKGQVVSKTIAQSKALSLTLFAFDKGERGPVGPTSRRGFESSFAFCY